MMYKAWPAPLPGILSVVRSLVSLSSPLGCQLWVGYTPQLPSWAQGLVLPDLLLPPQPASLSCVPSKDIMEFVLEMNLFLISTTRPRPRNVSWEYLPI